MRQREVLQTYLYKLVHGEKHGLAASLVLAILRAFSVLYGLGVVVKLSLYQFGILKRHKLPCKVISLGNITVGGTGKTPTALTLAATIRDMGNRVVILNRGYRAKWKGQVGLVSDGRKIYMSATEAGDEAYLLAKSLPGVAVVIGRDRTITGDYAVKHLQADVIILDDGYQHWQLARDIDIVLVDSLNMFGNNFLLPRGTLREPLSHLNRAHAFLLTKVDQSTSHVREALRGIFAQYNDHAITVESVHSPQSFIEIEEWYKGSASAAMDIEDIKGMKIFPFCAIGNPYSFEQTILDIGADIVGSEQFPDHHEYTMTEMHCLMQTAIDSGAAALITTDKDAVKIPSEFIHSERILPVYVLTIKVKFVEGYEQLLELIKDGNR